MCSCTTSDVIGFVPSLRRRERPVSPQLSDVKRQPPAVASSHCCCDIWRRDRRKRHTLRRRCLLYTPTREGKIRTCWPILISVRDRNSLVRKTCWRQLLSFIDREWNWQCVTLTTPSESLSNVNSFSLYKDRQGEKANSSQSVRMNECMINRLDGLVWACLLWREWDFHNAFHSLLMTLHIT